VPTKCPDDTVGRYPITLDPGALMPSPQPSSRARSLLVPALALVAVAALALAAFAGTSDDAGDEPGAGPEGTASDDAREAGEALARRDPDDPRALGDVDAPVMMIEWSDFQCPFCASFALDTMPELIDEYVEDGTLRFEWRDFPVLGEDSMTAAMAGRAAAEQDAFFEMHDEIFAREWERNAGELSVESLTEIAGELGLDTERFAQDMQDPDLERAVRDDLQLGQQIGFTGTPAFVINGRSMIGGQPTDTFRQIIDQAADEAGA
jgi:protein-disulfide isomerase